MVNNNYILQPADIEKIYRSLSIYFPIIKQTKLEIKSTYRTCARVKGRHIPPPYKYAILFGMKAYHYFCRWGYAEYSSINKILPWKRLLRPSQIAWCILLHEISHVLVNEKYGEQPLFKNSKRHNYHGQEFQDIYIPLLKQFNLY